MWIATASLPADLAQGLAQGCFAEVAQRSENDPATCFARGVALANTGHLREVRAALQGAAADPAYADAANVEIGFLDLNTPDAVALVAERATIVLNSAPQNSLLFGRASHLLGVARFRLLHRQMHWTRWRSLSKPTRIRVARPASRRSSILSAWCISGWAMRPLRLSRTRILSH